MTENWTNWTREKPPVEGAFATERGWEKPLAGTNPDDGLTEVIVAIGGLATAADEANIRSVVVLTDAGLLTDGEDLDIEVTFNENVDVTGTPRIEITLATGTVYADYVSGDGTNKLLFTYTVGSGDSDLDGIELVSPIDLNGGTIDDSVEDIAADLTFTAPDTSGYTVDALEPTIQTVASPQDGTDVDTGGTVQVVVTYDEAVVVTGTPQIPLFENDGTTPLAGNSGLADYASGSGTTAITFEYTVDAGDNEATGIKIGPDISLNGGTIEDAAGNAADLTFAQESTTLTLNQP